MKNIKVIESQALIEKSICLFENVETLLETIDIDSIEKASDIRTNFQYFIESLDPKDTLYLLQGFKDAYEESSLEMIKECAVDPRGFTKKINTILETVNLGSRSEILDESILGDAIKNSLINEAPLHDAGPGPIVTGKLK